MAGGLTLSGIAANLYRILARKPENSREAMLYFAVMAVAGPSVLFNNATKSFRDQSCSAFAYLFAVGITIYWSFALGLMILTVYTKV